MTCQLQDLTPAPRAVQFQVAPSSNAFPGNRDAVHEWVHLHPSQVLRRVLDKQKELGFEVFTDGELRRRLREADLSDLGRTFSERELCGYLIGIFTRSRWLRLELPSDVLSSTWYMD